MDEEFMKDINNKWDSATSLNGKLDVLKELFMTDNGDIDVKTTDFAKDITDDFLEYQTIENINIFDDFFLNTNFNNKYEYIIGNLKYYVSQNIGLNVLNKAKSINDIVKIKKDISAITNSNLYKDSEYDNFDLDKVFNILNINDRINLIDENSNINSNTIEKIINGSNDSDKEILFDKYYNIIASYKLYNIVESVQDEKIRKQIIIKHIELFESYNLRKIVILFKDSNNIKEILEKCDDNTLGYVITNIGDDKLKFNLTTIFLNRLDEYCLYKIIISVKDNNILNSLLEICINKLEGYSLYKIFDELYQRFNNADEKNDLNKFNELSDILDNITDKYLDKFFDNDISNILSLYDYEGKVELIDKYINKINFSWDEIIGNCDTLDEKIQLFNRYSKYIDLNLLVKIIKKIEIIDEKLFFINSVLNILKSEDLCSIILDLEEIDEINKMISLYREKLREEDIVKIVCRKYSDSDKLEFLNKDISYTSKITIISSLKDENFKKKYLEDNIEKLNGFELATILQTLSSDDDKIKYLYQYEKIFDNDDLTKVVSSIKDFNKKNSLIDNYKDKLDIATVASNCNPDEALIIMKIYSVLFSPMQLSMYVNFKLKFYLNEEKTTEFLLVFFDLIPPNQFVDYLLPFIPLVISSDLKFYLIDANFQYINDSDVRKVFYELSNSDELKLLEKYIDIIDSKKMCLALSTFDLDDVLENIKKYESKINKEDIIYIILGQISNLINNNQEINQDKLANIYSLIMDGKIDKNKCLDIINNLASLDIYSISAIDYYLLNNEFKDFINFDSFINILVKLSKSNSTEIQHLTPNLVSLLMNKEKSEQDKIINELENVFLRNNLPMMAKLYKVFDIMHPNFGEFNGFDYQSPNLNNKNNPLYKQIILFADLMKITIGSNNRSLKEYIKHIEIGNNIAKELIYNDIDIDSLDDNYKEILINYLNHLQTLYNNTLYGKNNPVRLSGNIKKDMLMLISLFGKNEKEFDIDKLPDRIVRMFSHFAGIDTMEELKKLMDTTIKTADQRNRDRAKLGKFEIHKGYFVKGIANQDKEDEFYTFLTNIFQNGSLCKELLGDAARSDTTPMDTDVSRMLEEPTSFLDAFTNPKYASSRYGPLWIVLKDDDRFNETNETNNKYIPGKLEVFETSMDGQGHYGIRTGFASSDIDYLVVDESKIKIERIKYEIVMNEFYIPLVNTKGNLVFTKEEYDLLHEKMLGLSYYNTENEYKFAPELDDFDINNTGYNIDIVQSINEVKKVREEVISKLKETGLNIKLGRSLDLKDKCIDLIDTGSTSRGTNKMDGYDFDFVMRVDKEIYTSNDNMNELYESFKKVFPDIKIDGHKIRKYKLILSNGKEVELDITFIMKTNKMEYSTEECLQDRLNTIKNMNEEKYKKVLENIVLAKYVLKSVYKSKNVADNPQGGLGGVGIENWILQNGGSFERAVRDFLDKANGRNFQEFCKIYTIWDFGQNNLSFKREDGYTHDEFITNNMSEEGYNKMVSVLKEYINTLEHSRQL